MEDITKKKQAYLRNEIIEAGYDAGVFVEYLAEQRENGEDIEVWSMQSLEDMVQRFKEKVVDVEPPLNDDEPTFPEFPDGTKTPEKPRESASQLSAKAQSFKNSHIRDDSEDEDERQIHEAQKALAQKSTAKDENQMAEDYIRRTVLDTKDAQNATKAAGMMSDVERQKKELLEKAVQEKKSSIVTLSY